MKITDNLRYAIQMGCDVLVVGAGASGIPAAIAAARSGSRVILLEEDWIPGGAAVDMYVTMLCGGPRVGLFLEMANRLNAGHNLPGHPAAPFIGAGSGDGRDYWYMPSAYNQVLDEMLGAEANIDVVCGAPVTGVLTEETPGRRRVRGAMVAAPGQPTRVYTAPVTIDATGSGLLAALAGCETRYGRDGRATFGEAHGPDQADTTVQPCTQMFISQRLRPDAVLPSGKLGVGKGGLVESNYGWVKPDDVEARRRNAGIYLHWGMTVVCEDTRDALAVGRAQREAWRNLAPVIADLRAHGFTVHLAPKLGVRESRRVMGETVVTATDLLESRYPEDTVAHCHFFLDAWGEHDQLPRTGVQAGIPYRALIPRGTEGLLVAGKAISGSHLAMSAYRVQPVMASVGTAAGVAAALAVSLKTGVRDIPLPSLLETLRLHYGLA